MAKMPDTPKVDLQLQRRLLPIYTARDALIREIKSNVSCVVVGETGSGKTTQIPQVWRVDRDVGGTIEYHVISMVELRCHFLTCLLVI